MRNVMKPLRPQIRFELSRLAGWCFSGPKAPRPCDGCPDCSLDLDFEVSDVLDEACKDANAGRSIGVIHADALDAVAVHCLRRFLLWAVRA